MSKAPREPRPKTAKPAPPPRVRGGRPRAVADLLPDIGRAAFRRFGFVQSSIVTRWGEIVGERYGRVSQPESLRFPPGERAQGVLTLTVVPAHGTMMQHIAPEIVERVNRFFGYAAVARIVFKPGSVSRPPAVASPAPPAIRPIELGENVLAIGDPELFKVLEALASGIEDSVDIAPIGRIG